MSRLRVRGRLLLGTDLVDGTIGVEDGRIASVERGSSANRDDHLLEASIVAPGLIDLQVNGGFGVEVGEDPNALRHLAACLPRTGVTAFLPTAVSSPPDFYLALWKAFQSARGTTGAHLLGIHVEGPFISSQRRGAHRQEVIDNADPMLMDVLLSDNLMRMITVAPERPGILDWIPVLRKAGVVVSLGHTNATHEQFVTGVDAGAAMATHLFNAMSPFVHRAPGAVGASLTDDRITAGLIADGIHCHPASLHLAVRSKGEKRIALVSDMMAAAGNGPGSYSLGGRTVMVDELSARLADGTLAGSILTLDAAVRNMVRWTDVGIAGALRMATEIPARLLGMDLGKIAVGLPADLVLFDTDLQVLVTVIGGEVVYVRGKNDLQ